MGVDAYAAAPLQAPEEAPGGYAPDLSPAGYSVDGPVGPVVEPGTLNDLVIRVVPAHGGKDALDAAIQDTDVAKPPDGYRPGPDLPVDRHPATGPGCPPVP